MKPAVTPFAKKVTKSSMPMWLTNPAKATNWNVHRKIVKRESMTHFWNKSWMKPHTKSSNSSSLITKFSSIRKRSSVRTRLAVTSWWRLRRMLPKLNAQSARGTFASNAWYLGTSASHAAQLRSPCTKGGYIKSAVKNVLNVKWRLKRMKDVTTCIVPNAITIGVGSAEALSYREDLMFIRKLNGFSLSVPS